MGLRGHAVHRRSELSLIVVLFQAKAELFRTLGDPVRVQVLELLRAGPKPVEELLAVIPTEGSRLYQQLAILRAAGLVTARHVGNCVEYSLSSSEVGELTRIARRVLRHVAIVQNPPRTDLNAGAGDASHGPSPKKDHQHDQHSTLGGRQQDPACGVDSY